MSALSRARPVSGPRRWRLLEADPGATGALAAATGLPALVAGLLLGRGVGTPEAVSAFLSPALRELHDPFLLRDMDRAVARLEQALAGDERITIYGDYDVDGVTSTASLVSFLRACGGQVDAYIPHRLREGYGLNLAAVEAIAARGTKLLVTCDCGVTAVEEVDRATECGLDVVVIDHHRAAAKLPRAAAILNPYQPGCGFPYRHLAAVGVTFELLMALRRRLREAGYFSARGLVEPRLTDWLDLVALGTVADVVPLTGENRLLVTHGLPRLSRSRRPGLRALAEVAGMDPEAPVTAGQVGFRLGPRINAAGRLADARAGLELLLTQDADEARRIAALLDAANRERQDLEAAIVEEATAQAEALGEVPGFVLAGEGWHRGVVGIVASRVAERFHRPTLVLGVEDGIVRGSGRSIPAFHLHEALTACESHLTRFGGHRAAAGLELPLAGLEAFREAFLRVCTERLTEDDLCPVLTLDAEVRPEALDLQLWEALERMAPFGMGNPGPVLLARGVRLSGLRVVGQGLPGHLKGRLGRIDVIGFGLGDRLARCSAGPVDLAFTLGVDDWRGARRLQARLVDVLPAGEAELIVERRAARSGEASAGHVHV